MNNRQLDVTMDGTLIGSVTMTAGGSLSFAYSDEYISTSTPTPLSLSMPLSRKKYGNRIIMPFLQGLLPDNPLALESMAARYGVSPSSPFALLEYVGHDVAGALQFLRPGQISEDANADRTALTPISEDALTQLLKNAIAVYSNGARSSGAYRMSLAGAQAKFGATTAPDGSWAIPDRGAPSTVIFKPQYADAGAFPDSDIVELFCQHVLAAAGIPAANTTWWSSPDGSVHAIVSQRFDRQHVDDGTFRRLHQEDFCQALSVPPSKKYQRQDGGPGIGQIGNLLKSQLQPQQSIDVATRFLEALTANIALLNTDAHAKNYALMLEGANVHLAPMYDVVSIGAFLTPDDHPLFSMRINGTYDLEHVFPESLVKEGLRLGLAAEQAQTIVWNTAHAIQSSLSQTAEQFTIPDTHRVIPRTIEAIEKHSALLKAL